MMMNRRAFSAAMVVGVPASDQTCSMSLNGRFEMKRRDMMKLASLVVMLPMMPGLAKADSENKAPPLRYKIYRHSPRPKP